jgi:hypothetical protein
VSNDLDRTEVTPLAAADDCSDDFARSACPPAVRRLEMRREFLSRLNKIPGVDLPEAKLGLRPGFPVELLTDAVSQEIFIDALTWFFHQANPAAK